MTAVPKYKALLPIDLVSRQWPGCQIKRSPVWAEVGLRDGNQALISPMTPSQKLEYFKMLCRIGFRQIEVGFPSASQEDYDFVQLLIEGKHIPDDVTIVVLVSCQSKLIEKTIESLCGVRRAIVHAYIASSDLHCQFVFGKTREQVTAIAVSATELIRDLAASQLTGSEIGYEFSPEEFTDTDFDFALAICTQVFDAWAQATAEKPMILNLPATVERRPPNEVADMIEWFCRNFPARDRVQISVHPHNDQGMAVASAYLSLLAGADRVEGVLFGHGERTGNLAIEVLAIDLSIRGIETGLDFRNIMEIRETVERLTSMSVPPRYPYSGDLVFTAFSGTHQDAIAKVLKVLKKIAQFFGMAWKVPYLIIDPADLGRRFERLIRVTSQSGKAGIAHVLERDFGIVLPKAFQTAFAAVIQPRLDELRREVSSEQLRDWLLAEFVNPAGPYELVGYWVDDDAKEDMTRGRAEIRLNGKLHNVTASGNGPIDAFAKALDQLGINGFSVTHDFAEGSLGDDQAATGIAFMPLVFGDNMMVFWGVGIHKKTHVAAARGIVAALNRRALAQQ